MRTVKKASASLTICHFFFAIERHLAFLSSVFVALFTMIATATATQSHNNSSNANNMCTQDNKTPAVRGKSAQNNGKGIPGQQEFYWSHETEPHAERRKAILKKYPEIKELYGPDPNLKYAAAFVVALQVFMASLAPSMAGWLFFVCAYVIGGTANHNLMLVCHELSHNLGFKNPTHNRFFSMFANLPLGVPSAISFKRYHLEHHRYQGEDHIDVDIPTLLEGAVFANAFMKTLFIFFQILFYGFRPLIVSPKKPTKMEAMSLACALSFDAAIYYLWGPSALAYLLASTFLGAGLHPVAGHFISEHYVFVEGQETYSYYGPLNWFCCNVGYHNEHHDFPAVAGANLPKVRAMAPEFYDNLTQCESWPGVIYNYIMDPTIGPFSRVKRYTLSDRDIVDIRARS
jgi:sphingolipid delta-4 desaturase